MPHFFMSLHESSHMYMLNFNSKLKPPKRPPPKNCNFENLSPVFPDNLFFSFFPLLWFFWAAWTKILDLSFVPWCWSKKVTRVTKMMINILTNFFRRQLWMLNFPNCFLHCVICFDSLPWLVVPLISCSRHYSIVSGCSNKNT